MIELGRKKNLKNGKEVKTEDKTYFWDIETSKIQTDQGQKIQVTYLSNVLTMNCTTGEITESIFHRTIEEVVEYFSTLPKGSIVWSHNLDYELTFLLRSTCWNMDNKITSLFRDKNAPLQVCFAELPNVTFRDSYALFNKGVEALGEDIGLPKLEYDYKKIRLPWDELEEHDYNYNKRDNEIVAIYLYNYMKDNNYTIDDVPLTFTSKVRRDRKQFIIENYGKKALTKFYFDRNKFLKCSHSMLEYFMKVYQGGLTASITTQTYKPIDNISTSGVVGCDIKSSYPNQLCTMKYPRFEEDNIVLGELAHEVWKSGYYKHFLGTFTFKNIRVKNENYILPISGSQMSKGSSSNAKSFNGKLISADELTIPLTNIDLDVIRLVYDFDEIRCNKILTTNKETYLRIEEVAFLLYNFLNKELGIDKAKAKLIINAMYGVKVSNPLKDKYSIEDGEIKVDEYYDHGEDERELIYNDFINNLSLYGGSLDVYSDGVYCTSYARKQLVTMVKYIVDNGGKVVYSDTDSVKFYCSTREEQKILINNILYMNNKKKENNKKLPRFKNFKEKFDLNEEQYNIISTLGIWEVEDLNEDKTEIAPHKLFITLGAKKYGYIDYKDTVKTTIAGCNKKNIPTVIKNVAKENNMTLEESFLFCLSCGTTFDETASGRTTAYKEDTPHELMHGLTYKGKLIKQYGGIIIDDTTYTLNMAIQDSKIIGNVESDIELCRISIDGKVYFPTIDEKGE